jgi:hypothetical protein
MVAPREWDFQVVDQIRLMNAPGSDEVLFRAGKRHLPADELLTSDIRAEAQRRAARPRAYPRPRSIGFRALLRR